MGTLELPTDVSRHLSSAMATLRPSPIRELLHLVDRPGVLSLAGGLPALSSTDAERVRSVIDRVLDRAGPLGPTALQYGPTEGVGALRERLAVDLGASVSEVLVTTGSQQGLDLLARATCDPGDVVVVEAPSYLGALQSFSVAGAHLVAIDGDDEGLDVERLASELAVGLRPKLVYVVANFHNPTGVVLAFERRVRLAELAARYGFFIIEDDPYGELRFGGDPVASIATIGGELGGPRAVPVVRLGSASKVLAPGLRVGWMTGPPAFIEAATLLKQSADLHTSCLSQLVVAELLDDEPGQRSHLDEVRARYREQAAAMAGALDGELGSRIASNAVRGGMFTWAWALDGTDTVDLFPRAVETGVAYVPGAAFSVDPDRFRGALRLSFATLDPAQIRVAVARLADAWRGR